MSFIVECPTECPTLNAGSRAAELRAGPTPLRAILAWPCRPSGAVLLLAGEGGIAARRRAAEFAARLRRAGLATLELDLGVSDWTGGRIGQPDVALIAERARSAAAWLQAQPEVNRLALGILAVGGASAGALVAAATSPGPVEAVVTFGGRPELAGDYLPRIEASTLLLSGDDLESVQQDRVAAWFVRHLVMERTWRAARSAS
jgi:putative phosphoribosyl transferase